MTRQRLGISHVHHALELAKRIETLSSALITALHAKSKQRAKIVAEVSMSHRVKRIVGKANVVHPIHRGMRAQKLCYLACILDVTLHPQGQSLNSLQEQEPVKRRKRGSGISLADC